MSLFKAREFWSTVVGENELFDLGCLCVADILNAGSDVIIVGSYHRRLSIYQPTLELNNGAKAEDVLYETQLSDPVLQIDAGHFVSGVTTLHLAVLHPRKLAIFSLSAKEGHTDQGVQYQLRCAYEHKLQRTSFNFCFGSFGGVKDRDFICIQSIDGTVSIFEQETFSFSRFLPGALLPGPIRYIRTIDSFITVASSCQVDCFKFQKLARATDEKGESQNISKGQRVVADWSFLISELGIDMVVSKFENTPLTIFVLGERNLYALSETGQLLYMKKFDFNPCCFLPYFAGKLNSIFTMVADYNKTLFIYDGVTMKWAARLSFIPVQCKLISIKGVDGQIVALDEQGHLCCFYLGTDPSFLSYPTSYIRELDYGSVDAEMKQLQKAIKEQQKTSAPILPTSSSSSSDDDIRLTISVPSCLDKTSEAIGVLIQDDLPIPSITVTVQLQAKCVINNVKLTCIVTPPLVATEPVVNIPSVAPGQPVETRVSFYMKYPLLPTDLRFTTVATYYIHSGAPRVVQSKSRLPLSLVIRPCQPVKNSTYKLTIDTNKSTVHIGELFTDLWGPNTESAANAVGFKYYGLDSVVTLLAAKSSQRYRVQCDNFGYMWHLTSELVSRLGGHYKMGSSSDFRVFFESPIPLQEYFELVDKHYQCRRHHETLTKTLEDLASQYRAVQKRLLIMFKDKTPTSLKSLDTLLEDTYNQIQSVAESVEVNREQQAVFSAELSCATCMINCLLRLKNTLTSEDAKVLDSILSSVVNDGSVQGWEEMVDASITHILRTSLSKNAKDVTLNPMPLSSLKDVQTIKKHIAMMCDRINKGARLADNSSVTASSSSRKPANVSNDNSEQNAAVEYRSLLKPQQMNGRHIAGGEPAAREDWNDSAEPVDGSTSFHKKKRVASDSVPDLDTVGRADVDGGAMTFNNGDELVYGLE